MLWCWPNLTLTSPSAVWDAGCHRDNLADWLDQCSNSEPQSRTKSKILTSNAAENAPSKFDAKRIKHEEKHGNTWKHMETSWTYHIRKPNFCGWQRRSRPAPDSELSQVCKGGDFTSTMFNASKIPAVGRFVFLSRVQLQVLHIQQLARMASDGAPAHFSTWSNMMTTGP